MKTMMMAILLVSALMIPAASAVNYWDFLTQSRADTLYCSIGGYCELGSLNVTGNVTVTNITVVNINSTGNVTADYFLGDGSQLTGIVHTVNGTDISVNEATVNGDLNVSNNIYAEGIIHSPTSLQATNAYGTSVITGHTYDFGRNGANYINAPATYGEFHFRPGGGADSFVLTYDGNTNVLGALTTTGLTTGTGGFATPENADFSGNNRGITWANVGMGLKRSGLNTIYAFGDLYGLVFEIRGNATVQEKLDVGDDLTLTGTGDIRIQNSSALQSWSRENSLYGNIFRTDEYDDVVFGDTQGYIDNVIWYANGIRMLDMLSNGFKFRQPLYSASDLVINDNLNVSENVSIEGDLDITKNLVVEGNFSAKRPYWVGFDNTTQHFVDTAAIQVINISYNGAADSYLIDVIGNQNLTFKQTGDYLCVLSPEFYQNSGINKHIMFWIQKNGVDVEWSGSQYDMDNGDYSAPAISFQFDVENPATDDIRFMWWSDSTSSQIASVQPQINPTRPGIPGIILNCQKVSEITG